MSTPTALTDPVTEPAATNVTVVVGTLAREPERRELPSGGTVLGLEVSVRSGSGGGPAEVVPVAWYDAPGPAERWKVGDRVVVCGRTRRRFFRLHGATQSRTEVVAAAVVPARRTAAARRALEVAVADLLEVLPR